MTSGIFTHTTGTAQGLGARAKRRLRSNARPVPPDYAERASEMTAAQLRRHYGIANNDTIKRWNRTAGVEPQPYDRRLSPPPPRKRKIQPGYAGPEPAFVTLLPRDMSIEGQAADVLRKTGPVYRCNPSGRANPNGPLWRYGIGLPMTGEELVERAMARGFQPDFAATVASLSEELRGEG